MYKLLVALLHAQYETLLIYVQLNLKPASSLMLSLVVSCTDHTPRVRKEKPELALVIITME